MSSRTRMEIQLSLELNPTSGQSLADLASLADQN